MIVLKLAKSVSVHSDRDRYGQVLINLLTNAMKYSPSGKQIKVTSKIKDSSLIVSVQDFGVGISKEKQPHIFERFYRANTEKDTYPGLGLGLYISKEIVERQGGKISVKSKEGKGSTFSFSIPLSKGRQVN